MRGEAQAPERQCRLSACWSLSAWLAPGGLDCCARACLCGADGDVLRARSLLSRSSSELDLLSLLECAVSRSLDCGEVHEEVLAVVLDDESESLRRVEPLDCAGLFAAAHVIAEASLRDGD